MQKNLGYVSDSTFKKHVKKGLIEDCEINEEDIERSISMCDTLNPILRGGMTSSKKKRNYSKQIQLPENVKKEIVIYVDILHVNYNPFLHVKSKEINYTSIEKIKDRKKETISEKLTKICNIYRKRGFIITDAYGDNEFDNEIYREILLPGRLYTCARNEHVPIVERSVRTIKEKARIICYSLPHAALPRTILHSLME